MFALSINLHNFLTSFFLILALSPILKIKKKEIENISYAKWRNTIKIEFFNKREICLFLGVHRITYLSFHFFQNFDNLNSKFCSFSFFPLFFWSFFVVSMSTNLLWMNLFLKFSERIQYKICIKIKKNSNTTISFITLLGYLLLFTNAHWVSENGFFLEMHVND